MNDSKFKLMTEQLRLTNTDEQVSEYLKWIITSDTAKEYWEDRFTSVEQRLPEDDINVLCYHIDSGSYFICHRTKDCITGESKWFGGAMPTHWKKLDFKN